MLGDVSLEVRCEGAAAIALSERLLGAHACDPGRAPSRRLLLRAGDGDRFVLEEPGAAPCEGPAGELGVALVERSLFHLIDENRAGLVVHSAAAALGDRAVVLPGVSGAGKSTLVAALVASGLSYLTDEVSLLDPRVAGFARALHVRRPSLPLLPRARAAIGHGALETAEGQLVPVPLAASAGWVAEADLALLVFPRYERGAALAFERLHAAEACRRLLELSVNTRNLPGRGLATAAALCRRCPAYALRYDDLAGACARIADCLIASL